MPAGNALLSMAFPEGSPTHPAYGAGHATVAGAYSFSVVCTTIVLSIERRDRSALLS